MLNSEADLLAAASEKDKQKIRHRIWNDRHGELFAYMHAQLLARYAAERKSLGLPPVVPLNDYRAPLQEDYDPGTHISVNWKGEELPVARRPPYALLNGLTSNDFKDRPGAQIASQETFRDRLSEAVSSLSANNRPSSISEFAELLEPTDRRATLYFGALHNDGHLLISMYDDNPAKKGCLFWEASAARDPVFYRWHAHIDSIFQQYQNGLEPYDFSDLPKSIKATEISITAASGQQNVLETQMRERQHRPVLTSTERIRYLSHEDFAYHISAENRSGADVSVTVRIFLSPEETSNERTAWIEMDKFRNVLSPGSNLIIRDSKLSSVVRHPVLTTDVLTQSEPPEERGGAPGCRCGWPYTLLLPHGTWDGMKFRVTALFTPGDDLSPDLVDGVESPSYCGVRDSTYPDRRAMGYPFDRQFQIPLHDWINSTDQASSANIYIKHISPHWEL